MSEGKEVDPVTKFLLDNQRIVSTVAKGAIDISGVWAKQQVDNLQQWLKEQVDLFFSNLEIQNRGYQKYISTLQNTSRPLFLYGRSERT